MKNKLFTLVLVFVSLVALCACGGDTAVTNSAVDLSDEPTYGGKVVVGITQDMDSLDPHKAVAAGTKEVLRECFCTLLLLLPGILNWQRNTMYTFLKGIMFS